jgi:hypothetical protein
VGKVITRVREKASDCRRIFKVVLLASRRGAASVRRPAGRQPAPAVRTVPGTGFNSRILMR